MCKFIVSKLVALKAGLKSLQKSWKYEEMQTHPTGLHSQQGILDARKYVGGQVVGGRSLAEVFSPRRILADANA